MSDHQAIPKPPAIRPIETVAEGKQLISHLLEVMDAMLRVIEHETALVKAGRVSEAAELETSKTELARAYVIDVQRLRASGPLVAGSLPESLEALRNRHDTFRALLQINLTVLATAHAVSESVIRGVAGTLARKAAPQTYGMSGRSTIPSSASVQPVIVSRTS